MPGDDFNLLPQFVKDAAKHMIQGVPFIVEPEVRDAVLEF